MALDELTDNCFPFFFIKGKLEIGINKNYFDFEIFK